MTKDEERDHRKARGHSSKYSFRGHFSIVEGCKCSRKPLHVESIGSQDDEYNRGGLKKRHDVRHPDHKED